MKRSKFKFFGQQKEILLKETSNGLSIPAIAAKYKLNKNSLYAQAFYLKLTINKYIKN
jgi:hypothetical protein